MFNNNYFGNLASVTTVHQQVLPDDFSPPSPLTLAQVIISGLSRYQVSHLTIASDSTLRLIPHSATTGVL